LELWLGRAQSLQIKNIVLSINKGITEEEILRCWGDRESGNTSKVSHAVDLYCKEYEAIKIYVKRFDGNTYLVTEEELKKTDGNT
jgi:hypothetical protein